MHFFLLFIGCLTSSTVIARLRVAGIYTLITKRSCESERTNANEFIYSSS